MMPATSAPAVQLLGTLTDQPLLGVWSAPGRANLIGEHTDYNDGFVLPFAIDRRTQVAVARRRDGLIRVASTFAEPPVEVAITQLSDWLPARRDELPEWSRYPLGVAWALLRAQDASPAFGVDLAIDSEVPVGAGLSSSAAIESAVAIALNDAWELGRDRVALAEAGRVAENEAVGAPTGLMDQMASMLGQPDAATFLDCRTLETASVHLGFDAADLALLVIDTRVAHAHSTGGYAERRASCERGARLMQVPSLRDVSVADLPRASSVLDEVTLRRVRHVVTENQRVLDTVQALRESGPRAIGELLVASHTSLRDDFEISVPELDTAVSAALAAGAVGARMTGGGFGGAAIALVDRERVNAVTTTITEAFQASSFAEPTVFTVTASEGARRDAEVTSRLNAPGSSGP